MNVQRGDVVMVDWIYSDRTGSKRRPALVVQSDTYNTVLDDTILALITSSTRRAVGAATQLQINISTPEGQQAGLSIDSVVQCENLVTIDRQLIYRIRGRLPAVLMRKIDACLKAVLELPEAQLGCSFSSFLPRLCIPARENSRKPLAVAGGVRCNRCRVHTICFRPADVFRGCNLCTCPPPFLLFDPAVCSSSCFC